MLVTSRPRGVSITVRKRLSHQITLDVPSPHHRLLILKQATSSFPMSSSLHLSDIADRCMGYVGADVMALSRMAFTTALNRQITNGTPTLQVTNDDWNIALSKYVKASFVSPFIFANLPSHVV
jgi:SpoVK/Ycf46/Vps4 family AAA+-type ATPase